MVVLDCVSANHSSQEIKIQLNNVIIVKGDSKARINLDMTFTPSNVYIILLDYKHTNHIPHLSI